MVSSVWLRTDCIGRACMGSKCTLLARGSGFQSLGSIRPQALKALGSNPHKVKLSKPLGRETPHPFQGRGGLSVGGVAPRAQVLLQLGCMTLYNM
eukprot:2318868-Amphidinium_carterae.1